MKEKQTTGESADSPLPTLSQTPSNLRQRAEEMLARSTPTAVDQPGNVERTLYELQVHQIELEMQNEELCRAQVELGISRMRYFDLYEMAPVGYFTLSEQGIILEANLSVTKLLGTARSWLVNQPLSRFVYSDDQEIYYLHLKHLFDTGAAQESEIRMLCVDSSLRWVQMNSSVEPDAGSAFVCRVVVSDISDRKQMEGAYSFLARFGYMDAREDFFQALARYLAQSLEMDYICIARLLGDGLSVQTVVVYHDGKFENNTQYALNNTPFSDVKAQMTFCFPRDVRRLFPRDVTLQNLQAESYVGTILWSCDGKPIGLIATIGRKPLANPKLAELMLKLVAVRAAGEMERRQAEESRDAAHQQSRAILESIGDGFFSVDRQWRVTYINERGTQLLAKSRAELLGKSLWESFPEAEALPFRQAYERALTEQVFTSVEAFFAPLNTWFEARAFPSAEGLSVFYQDITERKRSDEYREMGRDVLRILNESGDLQDSMQRALVALKTGTGLDAIGIRLQDVDESQHLARQGFSKDFLLTKNTLIARDAAGWGCRDKDGNACLECTCGMVLSAGTDLVNPLVTPGGSFWTNDSFPLPDTPPGEDPRLHPRNQCIRQEYASVALVPIRNKDRVIGLIQFNDRRKGCFTLGTVELLEGIALHIGSALVRKRAEAALRESEDALNRAQAVAHTGSWTVDLRNNEMLWSDENCRILGVTRGTPLTYETFLSTVHPEDRAYVHDKWSAALCGEPYDIEHRVVVGETIKWVHNRAVLEIDAQGVPCRWIGTTQDVTEEKKAEKEISSLARFPQETPSVVMRIQTDGTLMYANPASLLLLKALGGRKGLPAPERLLQSALAALASGERQKDEFTCSGRVFAITCVPFHKDGYVNIYGRDATEQRVAEEAARQARERERNALVLAAASRTAVDALDAMGEGVLLLQMDGRIVSINPALQRMIGYREEEVVDQPVERFVSRLVVEEDRGAVLNALRHALEGTEHGEKDFFTLTDRRGVPFPVLSGVSFIRNSDGKPTVVVVTLRDISELRAVQQMLAQSEQKYRELVENANSIIMRITPDHTITFFNEYAQKYFGYKAQEVVGRSVLGTIATEVDSGGRDLKQMFREISMHPELHGTNENENVRRDGRRVWVHWSNRAIRDDKGNVAEILCVGTDITRRRELEAEALRYQQRLRELAERLVVTEEEDRWRISRYIHDTIVQNLSLTSIRLGSMLKPLTDARLMEEDDKLRNVRELLNQAIDECRMAMSDLTPALLYELGLVPALHDFAQQLQTKHGTRMIVEDDGLDKPMSHPLRGLLFESVRELVMNALKHAGPCEIRVFASCRGHDLVIRIADNGRGFEPTKADAASNLKGGFGLFSIRQRMDGLGGRLEIDSAPGKGTTVTISVPMAELDGHKTLGSTH